MLNKKKISIIAAGFLILAFILALASRKSPPKEKLPDPSFQPFFTDNVNPETTFKDLAVLKEKTFPVYDPVITNKQSLGIFFAPLIDNLLLSFNSQSVNPDYLIWDNNTAQLRVKLATGQFTLKIQPVINNQGSNINEVDALNLAKNWLTKYKLVDPQTNVSTSYLASDGNELNPVKSKTDGGYFQFNFSPFLGEHPIFSNNYNEGAISVIVTNQGEIFYVNYQLPVLFYSRSLEGLKSLSYKEFALKSRQQIDKAITNNQVTIISSILADGIPQASTTKIKTINYKKIALGYLPSQTTPQLLPVFQLSGNGTLADGSTVAVTAYLPALSE